MANDIKWEGATVALTSYLTTDLNGIADENIQVGAAINNETNLCTYMDVEVKLASLDLSAQSNCAIYIYLLESVDGGTDFDTNTDNTATEALMPPADKICAILGIRPGSGAEAKVAVKSVIPIPPGRFKLGFRNKTGASLAASGNTLSYRTYNLQSV